MFADGLACNTHEGESTDTQKHSLHMQEYRKQHCVWCHNRKLTASSSDYELNLQSNV